MKCRVVRRHLLHAENPAAPPAQVRTHLAVCASCREWHRRLVQIERHVPLVPIPATPIPPETVFALVQKAAERQPEAAGKSAPPLVTAVRRLRSRVVLSGIAAALLLGMIGWWALRGPQAPVKNPTLHRPPEVDRLVQKLLDKDMDLARAKDPRQRVRLLAGLADELVNETYALARVAEVDDLQELAALYQRVVRDGILERAQGLKGAEERRELRPIAEGLERAEVRARRLAEEVPAAAAPLDQIASAAHDGRDKLSLLWGSETR
jgi:hypothetical protein